jgi:hypothetical protein
MKFECSQCGTITLNAQGAIEMAKRGWCVCCKRDAIKQDQQSAAIQKPGLLNKDYTSFVHEQSVQVIQQESG